jgi:hypothetical protein
VVSLTDELGGKLFADAVRGEDDKGKAAAPARLSDEEEKSLSRSVSEKKRKRRLEGRAHL